jgi:hypothetical protein
MSMQTAFPDYDIHITYGSVVMLSDKPRFFVWPNLGKLFLYYTLAAIAGAIIFLIVASLIAYPTQSYSVLSFILGLIAGGVAGVIASSRLIFYAISKLLNRIANQAR